MISIVRVWSAVFFAVLIVSASRPAFAVEGNWWFWTTANDANPLPFSECIRRAPAAIATQGLTASPRGNGNVFTVPSGPVWVSLMCVGQGRGFYMILNVASDGSQSSQAVGDAIGNAFWNGSSPTPGTAFGTWNWSATCNGSPYSGTFTISGLQPDGTFGGTFTQPSSSGYNGTIAGRLQSGRITFIRRWGTPDQQQWDGAIDSSGRMAGNIVGFGGPCTFSASKPSSTTLTANGGSPTNLIGGWNWFANCGGSMFNGTFTISNQQPDGTFAGTFLHPAAPSYNGPMAGRIQSGSVSFIRRWGSTDQQQWDGTLDQTGFRIAGNIAGYGCTGTFSASRQ